jgi:hypothetical protein
MKHSMGIFDGVCTVHRKQLYKQNQQDALSVCIYSTNLANVSAETFARFVQSCR